MWWNSTVSLCWKTLAKEICCYSYCLNINNISSVVFCNYCFSSSTITTKTSLNNNKVAVYYPLAKGNQRERKVPNYKCDMTKDAVWNPCGLQFSSSLNDILCKAPLSDQTASYNKNLSRNFLCLTKSRMTKVLTSFWITPHTQHRSWRAQESDALPTLCTLNSSYFLWRSNNPQKFIRTFWWSTIAFKHSNTK